MRPAGLLVAVSCIALSACQPSNVKESSLPRFEVAAPTDDFPVAVSSAFESTLGWLVTAEGRDQASPKEIRLPVAIIRARNQPSKSPVVYLSGGPGTSAMRTAAYPGAYPWLEDRDFIVIGQRGTHFAKPALMCPEYREAIASASDQVAAVLDCKARLEADGIGLDNYNSLASAEDLDDLRTALGIESWSLYAGSYGTRLALIYAKRFGERLESMVLDSPLPPNAIYDDESASNLERTLKSVSRDCAQQPACAQAFPELETRYFETLEAVGQAPVTIEGVDRPVTARDLAAVIPLTSESGVRRAPLAMDLAAKLDPDLLALLNGPRMATDFAWGMRFSVWCSEMLPFSERSKSAGPGDTLGGYESAAIRPELCEAWGVPALDASVIEPVRSDVPTLIIAGEFDPLTPPSWGMLAAQTLDQSRVVTIRGGSHSSSQQWGGDGCAMSIAYRFLQAPEEFLRAEVEPECLASRSAPEYLLQAE